MSCSVPRCSNIRRFKPEGVSFHTFPRGELVNKWLQVLGKDIETWVWTRSKFVCSQHFSPEDFIAMGHQRVLKFDAVPFVKSSTGVGVPEVTPSTSKDLLQSSQSISSSSLDPLQTSPLQVGNNTVRHRVKRKFSETRPSSATSSNSSQKKKRKIEFFRSIHSYSIRPEKIIKCKYSILKKKTLQIQQRLDKANRKLSSLQKEVTSLKIFVDDLKHQNLFSDHTAEDLEQK